MQVLSIFGSGPIHQSFYVETFWSLSAAVNETTGNLTHLLFKSLDSNLKVINSLVCLLLSLGGFLHQIRKKPVLHDYVANHFTFHIDYQQMFQNALHRALFHYMETLSNNLI